MSFDPVAPHYHWLERFVFGNQLQQARCAFVRQIPPPRRALVVGEGDGRFLAELLRENPVVRVDCIEASARMIDLARARVGEERTRFMQADIAEISLEENCYDLIVTHFFLDCFGEAPLRKVVAKLSRSATQEATWLIADFCEPPRGWRRLQARMLIAVMYAFFRAIAEIGARHLVDYTPLLRAEGFALTNELVLPNEMIRSQWWRRPAD